MAFSFLLIIIVICIAQNWKIEKPKKEEKPIKKIFS